ncbi:MAG TPA: hypothetical protein VIK28_11530 [Sedimentisphaerales bacterium]
MKDDPVISEIRRVRHEISARVGHDVRRLGEHYMELERKARASGRYRFAETPGKSEMALHDKPVEPKQE